MKKMILVIFPLLMLSIFTPRLIASEISWIDVASSLSINTVITEIVVDNKGYVYAGTYGKGLYMTTNNGKNWLNKTMPQGNNDILSLLVHANGSIYVGTSNGYLYRSKTNAKSWELLSQSDNTDPRIVDIATNATGNIYLAYGSGEIEIIDTDGAPITLMTSPYKPLRSIVVDNDNVAYVSTLYDGTYKTTNDGIRWIKITSGLPTSNVLSLAVDSRGTLFIGLGGNSGVFRSKNKGTTWTDISSGLDKRNVNTIKFITDELLIVGTNQGVYCSSDEGDNWTDVSGSTIADVSVNAITIDKSNFVYVGTNAGKIYRTQDAFINPTGVQDNEISMANTLNIFPNPAKNLTNVEITVTNYSSVRLFVCDLLGRIISNMVLPSLFLGKQIIPLETNNLSPGTYYVTINNGTVLTSKLLIITR